eukprot:gb/GECG01003211.1/.p1 GENE.gb/GECG01003211.1/~~gb/GECG01003211.1/.p1  ORF type:complete len:632 (+),score=48.55 gb/GECG01003211.1/:1-1896(+)
MKRSDEKKNNGLQNKWGLCIFLLLVALRTGDTGDHIPTILTPPLSDVQKELFPCLVSTHTKGLNHLVHIIAIKFCYCSVPHNCTLAANYWESIVLYGANSEAFAPYSSVGCTFALLLLLRSLKRVLSAVSSAIQQIMVRARVQAGFARRAFSCTYWANRKSRSQTLAALGTVTMYLLAVGNAEDLREDIIHGKEQCFAYLSEVKRFQMLCQIVSWGFHGYTATTHISLGSNETFHGAGGIINLSGIDRFHGLFRILEDVSSFDEAPLIQHVHARNGSIAAHKGFIIGGDERFVKVDSCSSTGDIDRHGGGVCGDSCGSDHGAVEITNCYSTGVIFGTGAGGIVGSGLGSNGGIAQLTKCSSYGNIDAKWAGGICGTRVANGHGNVSIKQSFSKGTIVATNGYCCSGGIVAGNAGHTRGSVRVEECFTTGQISASLSGGISGHDAGEMEGTLHIRDCYSTGDVGGSKAGGIVGGRAGGAPREGNGPFGQATGNINITNTYAAGSITYQYAGGIVGSVANEPAVAVYVEYSVHSGSGGVVGIDYLHQLATKTVSDNLADIRGQLYQNWDNCTWALNGSDTLPILRFQIPPNSPSPSATPSPSAALSPSPSELTALTKKSTIPVQRAARFSKGR